MVFSVPEIFEAILLHSTECDILRAQRVSHHWNAMIAQSLALQQKLFFEPITDKNYKPEFNPLLQKLLPPFFLLTKVPDYMYSELSVSAETIYELDWFLDERQWGSVLRPDASWRKMLPVQPLAKLDTIMDTSNCGCAPWSQSGVIKEHLQQIQQRGASMGFIYDTTIHLLDQPAEEHYFFIQWNMFPIAEERNEGLVVHDDTEKALDEKELDNRITIHLYNRTICYGGGSSMPTGLEIASFDEEMIEWTKCP